MIKLTVASCNLQNFHRHSAKEKRENFIKALIEPLNLPDIIALQEIAVITDEHTPLQATIPATALANELIAEIQNQSQVQYRYYEAPPLINQSGGAQDLNIRSAFLIKSDITVTDCYPLFSIHENGDEHTEETPFFQSRIPLVIKVKIDHTQLTLVNCHLKSQHAPTNQEKKIAKKQRNAQALLIVEKLIHNSSNNSNSTCDNLIILGDLNDTPNSDTLKILTSARLKSIWSIAEGRLYTTKHKNCPVILDYILVDSTLEVDNPQIFHLNTNLKSENRFSDHDPIAIDIYL